MSTSVTFNGTSYAIPAAGELNWTALSAFLIDVGQHAGLNITEKQAIRVALTTPITVSATADYCVVSKLTSPGAVAVTLPAGVDGQIFVILDGTGDGATNNITITPNGAETISGGATLVLTQNRQCVVIQYSSTGTTWNVIGGYYTALNTALNNPMTTAGDIVYGGASGVPNRLAKGASNTVLIAGTTPSYALIADANVSGSAAIAGSKIVTATASVAGVVDTNTQTFAGLKHFTGGINETDYQGMGVYFSSTFKAYDTSPGAYWRRNGSTGIDFYGTPATTANATVTANAALSLLATGVVNFPTAVTFGAGTDQVTNYVINTSYTPTLTSSGGDLAVTNLVISGKSTKFGNLVFVFASATWDTQTAGTGYYKISLPFTVHASASSSLGTVDMTRITLSASYTSVNMTTDAGLNYAYLSQNGSGQPSNRGSVVALNNTAVTRSISFYMVFTAA